MSDHSSNESLIPGKPQVTIEEHLSSSVTGSIHATQAADYQTDFLKEINKRKEADHLTTNDLLETYNIRKNKSTPNLRDVESAGDLVGPGKFRRQFLNRSTEYLSQHTPSTLDFILMYGHFAGGYYLESASDDENEPLLSPRRVTGASARKTYFLLLKSFVGTGILFLPRAFLNGGLLFSTIALLLVAFLTTWGMLLLIQVAKSYPNHSFGDIAERVYGPRAKTIVMISIIASQLGFCTAYFVFCAHNLKDALALFSQCQWQLDETWLIFAQVIIYVPLALVRRIHYFSFTSIIADIFILIGICYVLAGDFQEFGHLPTIQYINSWDKIALFMGTAVYTFEGVGLIVPISQAMEAPEKMPRVLSLCMLTVATLYALVGSTSYAAFGDNTQTVVLLNLDGTVALSIVQLLYVLAIVLSWPLQLFPALRILEQGIFPSDVYNGKHNLWHKWQKNLFRIGMVSVLSFVAWASRAQLELLVTFIGAFACIPLSFCWPSLLHYKTIADTRVKKIKDICLFLFGMISMLMVCGIALTKWSSGEADVPINRCK